MTSTKILHTIALLFIVTSICARPARLIVRTVTNSDGTSLNILLRGDESFHFYTTEDGIPVLRDANGNYRLAPEAIDSITSTWHAHRASTPTSMWFWV